MTAARLSPAAITGIGAITAAGLGAAQTAASVRAGVSNLQDHAFFLPTTRDPGWDDDDRLLCGAVPGIDPFLSGPSRLIELATMALNDLAKTSGLGRRDFANMALCLALPMNDDAVRTWGTQEIFVPDLLRRAGLSPFPVTRVLHNGHTGMIELLGVANALFHEHAVDRCLILGVDSYLTKDRLEVLDAAYRIRSDRNVDGFLPGEGASAVVIEPRSRAEARRAPVLLTATALGLGAEPRTASGDRQSSGAGLCDALRGALEGSGGAEWVICDLNGESYRSFEWGVAMARLTDKLGGLRRLTHPADCAGDIGAATGGVLMACAAMAFQRGYAPAEEATLFCASDGGERAAARFTR